HRRAGARRRAPRHDGLRRGVPARTRHRARRLAARRSQGPAARARARDPRSDRSPRARPPRLARVAARMSRARAALACAALAWAAPLDAAAHDDAHPFQRGICYASAWRSGGVAGYGSATSLRTLERLERLGAEWISLTPFGFMESPAAPEVRSGGARGPEHDERLHAEVAQAHGLGLKVALKPHVWIAGGDWPGDLKWPNDAAWRRWFASYRAFILRYAAIAERDHYDLLVLGTELKSATANDSAAWRALIADLRRAFHGPLTYAANWDEAERVPFWDALDFVGVDAYAPIAKKPG